MMQACKELQEWGVNKNFRNLALTVPVSSKRLGILAYSVYAVDTSFLVVIKEVEYAHFEVL
jgi:hypothetical protein